MFIMRFKVTLQSKTLACIVFLFFSVSIHAQPIIVNNAVEFDTPSIVKAPFSIGYILSPELEDHTYTTLQLQCYGNNQGIVIRNRDSHGRLVANVLETMFEGSSKLSDAPSLFAGYDLIVVVSNSPELKEDWFQTRSFSCFVFTPVPSPAEVTIWFKYQIKLFNASGNQIAGWESVGSGTAKDSDIFRGGIWAMVWGISQRILSNIWPSWRSASIANELAFLDMRNNLIADFTNALETQYQVPATPQEPR